ncbi:MAG TPA: hypothetical protein VMR73_02125, partial [Candidatus Paceibacterota bacterium]|nr:hypothetical protein [Candidatus Paceibacterota bacterium]
FDGQNRSDVFNSALEELSSSWPKSASVFLLTKPSASIGGYLFLLNQQTGTLSTVLSDMLGLDTIENSDGSFVFGSEINAGALHSFMYDTKAGTLRAISLTTLPEKCVWSINTTTEIYCAVPQSITSNNLPDDWYQGSLFLDGDDMWKIDATTGETQVVNFLSGENPNIDAENLFLDQNEIYMGFTNKKDLTLWALRLQ